MMMQLKRDALKLPLLIVLFVLVTAGVNIVRSGAVAAADKSGAGQPDRLVVIGAVEPVCLKAAGFVLPARIDTGATTSSLDAREIEKFERDGEKWVRFTVIDRSSGEEKQIESRMTRKVEITRHGAAPQIRPVVKLHAAIGKVNLLREFTLTDRSAFEYPLLIGRNILQGKFIVDVARKNTTSPMREKTE